MKTLLMFLLIAFNLSAQGLRSPGFLEQTLKYRIAAAAPGETLLLDEIGTAASLAYSVARKLRSAYSGNCITVYRVSDGTTSNIGFTGNELDTNSLASFCASTYCYVTNVFDQTVTGANLGNADTNACPFVVTNGVICVGSHGKPIMLFDTANDNLASTTVSVGPPISRFSVMFIYDFIANGALLQGGATTRQRVRADGGGSSSTFDLTNGGTAASTTDTASVNTWYLFTETYLGSAGTEKFRFNNGTENDVGDVGDNGMINAQLTQGGATHTPIHACEMVVYGADLSAGDETTLQNNFNAFYSIW